jgi:hypothetical protein
MHALTSPIGSTPRTTWGSHAQPTELVVISWLVTDPQDSGESTASRREGEGDASSSTLLD